MKYWKAILALLMLLALMVTSCTPAAAPTPYTRSQWSRRQ